ncbi:MAG TPA: hypothetical protein VNA25_05295, partial [Phycisphaerae bacterium]|nr:hypothetical protein [Phycisphaerae bacterium]
RGVFDRMLATEEEIADAEQANQFIPAPAIAELMSDTERAGYQKAADVARERGILELEQAKIAEKTREETARWKEDYEVIRAEVAAGVDGQPVYQAIDAIRDPSSDLYLDRDAVDDLLGEDDTKRLPSDLTRVSRGTHPDFVAEQFGFSSGHEMLLAMMNAAKNKTERAELVKELATDTMVERHGSLNDNAAQAAEAASEIVHNDRRGTFLAMELRAIARASKGKPTPASVAKAVAQRIIAQKKFRDAVKVGQYAAAEIRYAKETTRALLKGDTQAAEEAKRHQLLHHYLYMEALKGRKEMDSMLDYFGKFRRRSKTIDREYSEQIEALLEKYEFRRAISMKEAGRRKSLAQFIVDQSKDKQDDGTLTVPMPISIDDDMLRDIQRQHYTDTPLEELRGLKDAVKHLEHLGRLKNRLLTLKDKRELDAVVAELATSIRANWKGEEWHRTASKTRIDKAVDFYETNLNLQKPEHLFRELDGFKPGPMQEILWNLLSDPNDELQSRRIAAADVIREMYKDVGVREARAIFKKKVFIPEINDSITKETMIAAALNMGTHDNKAKWLKGWGWGQAGLDAVLDKLTKADWDLVQAKLNYLATFHDETVALNNETMGKNPPDIEATPIETKFGTYPGGYYPVKYQMDKSTHTQRNSTMEIYKRMVMGDTVRPVTNTGRTNERIDSGISPEELAAGLPAEVTGKNRIRTDLGVFFEAVEETMHDLAFRKAAADISKILRHPDMIDVLHETIGENGYSNLSDWLQDGVAGGVQTNPGWVDKAAGFLRRRTTAAAMGAKLSTMFLQPLGYLNTLSRFIEEAGQIQGFKHGMHGLRKFYAHPKDMKAWVDAKSEFMRNRVRTWDRDAMAVLNSLANPATKIESAYFMHIAMAQLAVDYPTWIAAYDFYSEANPEKGDEAAVKYANSFVRTTQGSGAEMDLAPIQKGSEVTRNFNMFMTFFSNNTNMLMNNAKQLKRNPTIAQAAIFSSNMFLIGIMPVVAEKMLYYAAGVQGPDKKDDESLGEWLFKEWLLFIVGGIPVVRDAMSHWVEDFPFSVTPTTSTLKAAVDLPNQIVESVEKGELDRGLLKAGAAAASLASPIALPTGQMFLIGDYLENWFETGEPANPAQLVRRPPRHMRE